MRTNLWWLLALGGASLAGCQPDDPASSLPAPTHEGLNTGGCLINGQAYVATATSGQLLSSWGSVGALSGGFYWDFRGTQLQPPRDLYDPTKPYILSLNCRQKNQTAHILLYLRQAQAATYALNRASGRVPSAPDSLLFDHATVALGDGNGEYYATDAQHPGQVVITYSNASARISAGTFEFTAGSNQQPGRSLTITLGRFDRKQ